MQVQILGTGCPKCQALERNARQAVAQAGIGAEVVKVTDIDQIMNMGVMVTPALAIDGVVKKAGKILTVEEIVSIIKEKN
jgi:small redox-active disulfide protein 2